LRISDLDACLPDEPVKWGGALSPEHLAWLDSKLTKHSREMNLIFMHHNFLAWSEDEMTGGPKQCFNIDNAAKVRAILSKHSHAAPVAISGHRHIGLNYADGFRD
jgi:hypothetical protein